MNQKYFSHNNLITLYINQLHFTPKNSNKELHQI